MTTNQKPETRNQKVRVLSALCFLLSAMPLYALAPVGSLPGVVDADRHPVPKSTSTLASPMDNEVSVILQSLNKIPEDQLNEKTGMAVPLMDQLRSLDAPEYIKLRALVGHAEVRKSLNPGVKYLLAGLLAPRWDGFTIAGNLYLAALKSTNTDFRARARQKLIGFIQPAHIPVLINTLVTPGPNVLAFEVLQEVTGQTMDPTPKAWLTWWAKNHGQVDLVGHMLNQSRIQLAQAQIHTFDQSMLWYLPDGISHASGRIDKRPIAEQNAIGQWNEWANTDVKNYVSDWERYKPMFERIVHQPDPRVGDYLITLTSDPGFGDYASVVLAWRSHKGADKPIQQAYLQWPTVGRALAMGALGNKESLQDLLNIVSMHKNPLTYGIMDDAVRGYAAKLPALGVVSAEQAFELLTHQKFGLASADTRSEKKKALKKAQRWLKDNYDSLTLDRQRGCYVTPNQK